jgi:hypothetical protein
MERSHGPLHPTRKHQHYQELLKLVKDETERQRILKLLAEEQQKQKEAGRDNIGD